MPVIVKNEIQIGAYVDMAGFSLFYVIILFKLFYDTVCFQMLVTFSRLFSEVSAFAQPTHRTKNQIRKLCIGGHLIKKSSQKRD